jgi:alpha-beta hydrolase superfamily lysophospholipase
MGPRGGRAVIDDLHELRTAALSSVGDVPVMLFGHSMGSLIALAYLTRHAGGLAGGVLCGVPVNLDDTASLAELLDGLAEAGLRDQPATDLLGSNNTPFEPARPPFDWLSRDPDELDRYLADPLCGDDNPLTYGYLIDRFNVVARLATSSARAPVPSS